MNAPYPIPGSQGIQTQFTADNTFVLGNIDKPIDAITWIGIDYSQLPTPFTIGLQSSWFRVKPGGSPQLEVYGAIIASNQTPANLFLEFILIGGIAGQTYEVIVNTSYLNGIVRSDLLTVNALGDGCNICSPPQTPVPYGIGAGVSSDGSIIANTVPRFFVSNTPPASANVLDQWYDTSTGQLFGFISNGEWNQWLLIGGQGAGSGGGGSGGGGSFGIVNVNPIKPDGITTSFILTAVINSITIAISDPIRLLVSVDGVWQQAGKQYTAASNWIEFAEAPSADSNIFMIWFS